MTESTSSFKIIGRKEEQQILEELYQRNVPNLVAVYGRRRVGKTYLVASVFGSRIPFRHTGIQPIDNCKKAYKSETKRQLEAFFISLQSYGWEETNLPKNWLEAFAMLERLLEKKKAERKSVLFFDEIQWMDTSHSDFISAFGYFYNQWASVHNVLVVICGSSTSWIQNKLINSHGGLYDRVTREIALKPFTLKECEEYVSQFGIEMSRYTLSCCYMTFGGIPFYWNYLTKNKSLVQNIDMLFFQQNGPLRSEFSRLFRSLFDHSDSVESIIRALFCKSRGLTRSEISAQTGIKKNGDLTSMLNSLIAGDFIVKYVSFGQNKKEPLYKLTDPFCLFYLNFVDKESSFGEGTWLKISDSPKVRTWQGLAFENVCFHHIPQIKDALGIRNLETSQSLWSKKGNDEDPGTQIDLILYRKDMICNMCEIKFLEDEFTIDKDYHLILTRRKNLLKEVLPKRFSVQNVLISSYGLKKNSYQNDFAYVLTLDDLFR